MQAMALLTTSHLVQLLMIMLAGRGVLAGLTACLLSQNLPDVHGSDEYYHWANRSSLDTLWGQCALHEQALYIIAVVVMFPASILACAAGAVFGVPLAFTLVWTANTIGQTLAFLAGRWAL